MTMMYVYEKCSHVLVFQQRTIYRMNSNILSRINGPDSAWVSETDMSDMKTSLDAS